VVVEQAEQLREDAHGAVLDGLAAGQTLGEIEQQVGRSNVRGVYTPDLAMFELIIAALDVAGVSRDRPLATWGWREQFLPELSWRNQHREIERLVYALQTAAAFRTGLRPDVLDDTYSWNATALWPYATRAAVMTIRAVADGRDIADVCERVRRAVGELDQQRGE
jgi:hypothetical protein